MTRHHPTGRVGAPSASPSMASRALSFDSPGRGVAAGGDVGVTELRSFAEQLASAFASERQEHAATRRALGKAERSKATLKQAVEKMESEWRARKQSWHTSHNKHLHLRDKYAKLLAAVRATAARHRVAAAPEAPECVEAAAVSEEEDGPTPPLDIISHVTLDADLANATAEPTPIADHHTQQAETPTPALQSSMAAPPAPRRPTRRQNARRESQGATPAPPPPRRANPPAGATVKPKDKSSSRVADSMGRRERSTRMEACTPQAFWGMGFVDEEESADDDPFNAALAEYRSETAEHERRGSEAGGQRNRTRRLHTRAHVAVESQPLDDYTGGVKQFARHVRQRRSATTPHISTPSVAGLTLD